MEVGTEKRLYNEEIILKVRNKVKLSISQGS